MPDCERERALLMNKYMAACLADIKFRLWPPFWDQFHFNCISLFPISFQPVFNRGRKKNLLVARNRKKYKKNSRTENWMCVYVVLERFTRKAPQASFIYIFHNILILLTDTHPYSLGCECFFKFRCEMRNFFIIIESFFLKPFSRFSSSLKLASSDYKVSFYDDRPTVALISRLLLHIMWHKLLLLERRFPS